MTLSFPPLMHGVQVAADAMGAAVNAAQTGCDAGLVVYTLGPDVAEAALVLTPEVPLGEAMSMLPLCAVGFQNALGALAPPEVAIHFTWDGGILVNGASCGRMTVRSAATNPNAPVDWLIVGFEVPFLPDRDDMGAEPDRTALYAEGCGDVTPGALVESWARHTLHWINRWEDEGARGIHGEWRGLAHGIGEPVTVSGRNGIFLGIDESFGLLLRDGSDTHLIPLTRLLEAA